jgi:hypothetical protein
MNQNDSQEALERLLDQALKELPLRRAPATLQSKVLAELERRAALPWWRRSFGHWPRSARAAFLLLCAALVGVALIGGIAALDEIGSLPLTHQALAIVTTAADLAALVARYAPPSWVYDLIVLCAVLYGVLFGLGAVVYRTLYLQPRSGA